MFQVCFTTKDTEIEKVERPKHSSCILLPTGITKKRITFYGNIFECICYAVLTLEAFPIKVSELYPVGKHIELVTVTYHGIIQTEENIVVTVEISAVISFL